MYLLKVARFLSFKLVSLSLTSSMVHIAEAQ